MATQPCLSMNPQTLPARTAASPSENAPASSNCVPITMDPEGSTNPHLPFTDTAANPSEKSRVDSNSKTILPDLSMNTSRQRRSILSEIPPQLVADGTEGGASRPPLSVST